MNFLFPHNRSEFRSIKTNFTDIAAKILFAARSEGMFGQSLRGGGFLTIGSFVENLGRFARNIILARLIAPEAFGIMATVIASVAVIEAITQVGLRQSTIQNKNGGEEGFLNAVWWISSLRGLALYLIAFFASPFISSYFGAPDSAYILRTGFLVILFNGLISPRIHLLEKELRFKNWIILMQGAGILGVVIAIVSAFYLENVWSLLLGYIGEAIIRLILSFVFCSIKPKFRISKLYIKDILQFSKKLFGLPFLMMIYAQLDIYVIGRVLTLKELGMYVLVRSLSDMPSTFFAKIVEPIVLPVFSKMQDDFDKLRNTLFIITEISGSFLIPFIAFMICFAQSILRIIYGSDYVLLTVPFAIMNVAVLILMMASLIVQTYFAVGLPNIHRNASIVRTLVFVILIYPATKYYGLTGTAIASLCAMSLLITIQIYYARKLFNFSPRQYIMNWIPGIKSSIIVIIPGIATNLLFDVQGISFLVLGIILCLVAWAYSIISIIMCHHRSINKRTEIN